MNHPPSYKLARFLRQSLRAVFLYSCATLPTVADIELNLELQEIEQYLQEQESTLPDLVQGTEKSIRWANPGSSVVGSTGPASLVQTEYSIVYIHGFSASRGEISPVTEQLADRIKANVYYARLRGHGRSSDAMTQGSVDAWLEDTKEAYEIGSLIGRKVILVSTSTGGTLATWLLAQPFTKNVVANIMVSPNFGINNWSGELLRWSWGLSLAKWMNGDYHSFTPQNELHKKYWTERYPYEALVPMIKLVDQVVEMEKSNVKTPQLIIYSPSDHVVDSEKTLSVANDFSSSEVTLSPFTTSSDPSQHVLAGDACAPDSTEEMVQLMHHYVLNLD